MINPLNVLPIEPRERPPEPGLAEDRSAQTDERPFSSWLEESFNDNHRPPAKNPANPGDTPSEPTPPQAQAETENDLADLIDAPDGEILFFATLPATAPEATLAANAENEGSANLLQQATPGTTGTLAPPAKPQTPPSGNAGGEPSIPLAPPTTGSAPVAETAEAPAPENALGQDTVSLSSPTPANLSAPELAAPASPPPAVQAESLPAQEPLAAASGEPDVLEMAMADPFSPTSEQSIAATEISAEALPPPTPANRPAETEWAPPPPPKTSAETSELAIQPSKESGSAGNESGSQSFQSHSGTFSPPPAEGVFQTGPTGSTTTAVSVPPAPPPAASDSPLPQSMDLATLSQNLDRIVLNSIRADGNGIRVELEPVSLGRMLVHCRETSEGLSVEISVQNSQIRSWITAQEQDLRANLESQGMQMGRFSVSCRDGEGRSDADHSGQQREQGSTSPDDRRAPKASASVETPDAGRRARVGAKNRWVA